MTTIEHLAVANLRLAQKCAKKDDFIEGMKRTVSAHIAKSSEMGRQRDAAQLDRFHAEAKLADAERRLRDANNDRLYHCAYCGETGDMSAIADHSKVCAKHPMREVERERDAASETARQAGWQRDEFKKMADVALAQRDAEKARADRMETAWSAIGIRADKDDREVERLTERCRALERKVAEMGIHADNDHRSHMALDSAKAEVERLQRIAFPDGLENDAAVSAKWFMSERKFYSAEVEWLRGIIGRARAKGESDGTSSAGAVLFNVCAILREVDVPTVPSGFPGNLLREADPPPAKPRRMKANAPQQGRQSSTLSEDVGKL